MHTKQTSDKKRMRLSESCTKEKNNKRMKFPKINKVIHRIATHFHRHSQKRY